jgi:mannonate dehydratase
MELIEMRIALVLTPPTERHFRWAAQVGAADYVARYPTVNTPDKLRAECERAAKYGLKLSVVEGYLPMDAIIHGLAERDTYIHKIICLIEAMGRLGIEVLCYNWMPNSDWTRTSCEESERGGALTNSFDLKLCKVLTPPERRTSADALWRNLEYFLRRITPVAESAGVKLAMHPDDPPLPELQGAAQIMHSPEHFERLLDITDSPANGMCFCQGTFAELGLDIPSMIGRFHSKIHYVHFRDVRGDATCFTETFHDNGPTDMAAAMRAYRDIGFAGTMRPDHVPKLDGEDGLADGYTMLGRLFAVGYMRGLMHATAAENRA